MYTTCMHMCRLLGICVVVAQVTNSGSTVPTVGPPQAVRRLYALGLGRAETPSPTRAQRAWLGTGRSPAGPQPSGQWATVCPLFVLQELGTLAVFHKTAGELCCLAQVRTAP